VARAIRILGGLFFAILLIAFGLYSLTGLFLVPPKNSPPDGETIWFYRRGSGLPVLSSVDSRRIARENAGSPELVPVAPRADRIIRKFPFNRALYLRTTGGIEYLR
jgi:hypothetical protein